ncbi:hypothetical protein M3M50_16295 [Pseudomonas bijieensis]|uniref:hypothetical protein n=1 Tax=Pseudomonas bijieensis TaxID=2681983 RepID=UPI002010650E|nr:hypothetical protein [Pseudomonas bijieensis]UQI28537.1 hypothetical protein M3M50_16295 [Pseudomonas bijieensis]
MTQHDQLVGTKDFYSPLEAAIRWSGLLEQEAHVFKLIALMTRPTSEALVQWPLLALNVERLYNALRRRELPSWAHGTIHDKSMLVKTPYLAIRHNDLKQWMSCAHPDQKPLFLFAQHDQKRHESDLQDVVLTHASETILMNIIGSLLTLMLGQTCSGARYSTFSSLDSVIHALVVYHGNRPGVCEPMLRTTFEKARRHLSALPLPGL